MLYFLSVLIAGEKITIHGNQTYIIGSQSYCDQQSTVLYLSFLTINNEVVNFLTMDQWHFCYTYLSIFNQSHYNSQLSIDWTSLNTKYFFAFVNLLNNEVELTYTCFSYYLYTCAPTMVQLLFDEVLYRFLQKEI